MAEGKKSFIAYADWKETFEALPDEKAGQLIKHIFSYVADENPKTEDFIINAVFANIKHTLKRDLIKWESYIEKQSENGKKGGRPRKEVKPKNPSLNLNNPIEPKKADSVNVNVNDSVNENEDINTIVNRIYIRYPSKCVVKNSSTSKSSKPDKLKIKKLLTEFTEFELISKIDWYVNECRKSKTYMKNFSTFLNNLPDTTETKPNKDSNLKKFNIKSIFGYSREFEAETIEQAKDMYCKFHGVKLEDVL